MSHIDRYTCEEAFLRLDDYLDRELPADQMECVRQHLETCAICASRPPRPDVPHLLPDRLRPRR